MAEQENVGGNVQFLLSDFGTRLRDLEERNRLIRERVLLLGQNLISSREEIAEELKILKKDSEETKRNVQKTMRLVESISNDIGKFVRRDEMRVVERMLKDFQPLEFVRQSDIEETVKEALKTKDSKHIKTKKSKN